MHGATPLGRYRETKMAEVHVFDGLLDAQSHRTLWEYLNRPGWTPGAYSDEAEGADRYSFKHFAGYSASGTEDRDPAQIAAELRGDFPPLYNLWCGIERAILNDHRLSRCYANLMPPGIGGGVHRDSTVPGHATVIYYPNLSWANRDGGETLFFDDAERDVIKAVTPQPNRLVVFAGTIPHVARPVSRRCTDGRITLMFKTLGAPAAAD